MADFKLDRIKFRWKGNWVSGNTYTKDDIVYYEGKAFVCLQEHAASESFYTDFESAGAGLEPLAITVSTDTLNGQAAGKFYIDGVESPELNLVRGRTYEFVQNDSSNLTFNESNNILLLSTLRDGELAGGPLYETGVTYRLDLSVVTRAEYIAGFATATDRRIRFVVPTSGAERIFYYSNNNENLGNVLNTKYASNWEVMQDGYTWKGDWIGDTFYPVDSIVKFKGYLYKATADHTSGATSDGLTTSIASWSLFATGYNWLNTWNTSTAYDAGDVVRNNGNVYVCVARHISAATVALGLEADGPSWLRVTLSDDWRQDWTTATKYVVNDLVKYGATVYRCVINHVSADNTADGLELDQSKWEEVTQGVEYKGEWSSTTRYKVGDIVRESASLYKCISGHTSSTIFNEDNPYPVGSSIVWETYIPGLRYEDLWSENTQYSKGDIVLYGGYSYVATGSNLNKLPSDSAGGFWDLLKTGYKHRGEWADNINYLTGDVIRNNGYLYLAIKDNLGIYPDSDESSWKVLVTGSYWRAEWEDDVEYFLGDIVTYKSTAYICIARHTSTASDSRPDLDLQQDDQDYWNILVKGDDSAVMANVGDIIIATDADADSTVDKTELPIGLPGQVLKVSDQILPSWSAFEEIPDVYYVSTSGIDSTTSGKSLAAPFRTVKYACEYINANRNKTLITTSLAVGVLKLANGESFPNATRYETLLSTTNPNTTRAYADVTSNGSVTEDDYTEFSRYINYYVNKIGGTPPTAAYVSACKDLYDKIVADFDIIKDDYFEYDNVIYNIGKLKNTTIFIKTGLYEEILPISIPAETALVGDELRSTNIQPAAGYETSNMFYVRNGSGIRNMTLQGLYGELGELNSFLTRRPSAGAFVSLDPGSGPGDKSVWITNKSPYVQNVTTFGTACIGMKIDGSLHDGGNDSIVANDFTQVISDGIGYWADNVGRSELVSVFTYYCHIGYLATNGGILRATNGNNSYGEYGSVAEGYDLNELPITGTVNNRSKEAQVEEIFTYGTTAQQILALGYSHAGQSYSSAGITFGGAGLNAAGSFTEFRDGAISNIRVLSPGDSSIPGGLNYTFVRNNAQGGDPTFIQLSAADIADDLDYIGQRIVIISGLGVGQYAEITDYNSSTKKVIVSKESDGSSGWDHFQPGWPIEPVLDGTTTYVIEPKVTAEEPSFTASSIATGLSTNSWKYVATNGDATILAVPATIDETYAYSLNSGSSWTAGGSALGTLECQGVVWTGQEFVVAGVPSWYITSGGNPASFTENAVVGDDIVSVASNGNGGLVISLSSGDVLYSTDHGSTTTAASGLAGISAYGNGKYVIIANDGNVAYSTNNGATWTTTASAVSARAWNEVTWGNGRFVAISTADNIVARSFDGINWYESEITSGQTLNRVSYGAGVFLASGDTDQLAVSKGGDTWRTYADDSTLYTASTTGNWTGSAYIQNSSRWILLNSGDGTWNTIQTGSRPILRAKVESSRITKLFVYDPGSNYATTPDVSIYDTQNTVEASFTVYLNNGVLPQPTMSNRGTGYTTATATITGNGFAELYQENSTKLVVSGIARIPGPGANLNINGIDDVQYSISVVDSFTGTGPYNAVFTITPSIGTEEAPDHATTFEIRERYSQIRLTGHDFLDIGTGNVSSTRYPNLYLEGEDPESPRQPFNETVAKGGGRVFYTSTDQDGNFRVGELFAVEQSTGIVTINASQFDLSGLTELSLGGIQVGGSAVVIREFSKDPNFIANSNNIVPTQKAIKSYIESRISGGGSNASTNRLIAGQIDISSRQITTTSGLQINLPQKINLQGGIDGDYLAIQYFASGGAFGAE